MARACPCSSQPALALSSGIPAPAIADRPRPFIASGVLPSISTTLRLCGSWPHTTLPTRDPRDTTSPSSAPSVHSTNRACALHLHACPHDCFPEFTNKRRRRAGDVKSIILIGMHSSCCVKDVARDVPSRSRLFRIGFIRLVAAASDLGHGNRDPDRSVISDVTWPARLLINRQIRHYVTWTADT